jgi:hypothetical protein
LDGEAAQLRKESEAVALKVKSGLSTLNEEANNFRNASKVKSLCIKLRAGMKTCLLKYFVQDLNL